MPGGPNSIRRKCSRWTSPRLPWRWRSGGRAIPPPWRGSIHRPPPRFPPRGKGWRNWVRWTGKGASPISAASLRSSRSSLRWPPWCCSAPKRATHKARHGWRCCCRNAGWAAGERICPRGWPAGRRIDRPGRKPRGNWRRAGRGRPAAFDKLRPSGDRTQAPNPLMLSLSKHTRNLSASSSPAPCRAILPESATIRAKAGSAPAAGATRSIPRPRWRGRSGSPSGMRRGRPGLRG